MPRSDSAHAFAAIGTALAGGDSAAVPVRRLFAFPLFLIFCASRRGRDDPFTVGLSNGAFWPACLWCQKSQLPTSRLLQSPVRRSVRDPSAPRFPAV